MRVTVINKFPSEDRAYEFDFSEFPEIEKNGETISSVTSATASPSGLTIGATSILSGSKKVSVRISSGTAGQVYKVIVYVATSGSNTLGILGELNVLATT